MLSKCLAGPLPLRHALRLHRSRRAANRNLPRVRAGDFLSRPLAEAVKMETERSVMRSYPTGSRGREMSGNDHDRAIGEGLEEAPPCRSRRLRVDAEAAVELRLGA